MLASGVQQSGPVTHIHISALFKTLFTYRSLRNTEQSPLRCTVESLVAVCRTYSRAYVSTPVSQFTLAPALPPGSHACFLRLWLSLCFGDEFVCTFFFKQWHRLVVVLCLTFCTQHGKRCYCGHSLGLPKPCSSHCPELAERGLLTLTLVPFSHCGGGWPVSESTGVPTWLPPARPRNWGAPPVELLTVRDWSQVPGWVQAAGPIWSSLRSTYSCRGRKREKGILTNQN